MTIVSIAIVLSIHLNLGQVGDCGHRFIPLAVLCYKLVLFISKIAEIPINN